MSLTPIIKVSPLLNSIKVFCTGMIINNGSSVINGNIAISYSISLANNFIVNFPPGKITGKQFINDMVASQVKNDIFTILNNIYTYKPTTIYNDSINFSNKKIGPGIYEIGGSCIINNKIIFDGLNNKGSYFIFRIGSTKGNLIIGPKCKFELINNADSSKIFWTIIGSAIVKNETNFLGNIIALGDIIFNDKSTSKNNLWAINADSEINSSLFQTTGSLILYNARV